MQGHDQARVAYVRISDEQTTDDIADACRAAHVERGADLNNVTRRAVGLARAEDLGVPVT